MLLLCLGLTSCASRTAPRAVDPELDLHHPDPRRRAEAVGRVAAAADRRYVEDLIELLDDDDASVRLVAIGALREVTGRDSGYRAYAPREERRRWMAEWRAGGAVEAPSAAPEPAPAAGSPPAAGSATAATVPAPAPAGALPPPTVRPSRARSSGRVP